MRLRALALIARPLPLRMGARLFDAQHAVGFANRFAAVHFFLHPTRAGVEGEIDVEPEVILEGGQLATALHTTVSGRKLGLGVALHFLPADRALGAFFLQAFHRLCDGGGAVVDTTGFGGLAGRVSDEHFLGHAYSLPKKAA